MKRLFIAVLAFCVAGTFAFANGSAESKKGSAAPQTAYVCKIANAFAADAPRYKAMQWLANELPKRTNGRIKTEYYGNGVLGKEEEMFQMTATDQVQVYEGGGWQNLSGGLSLWSIPFAFKSYDQIIAFDKTPFAQSIAKESSKNGIYVPVIGFTGFRNVQFVSKKVEHPQDVVGLKMRAPGQPLILGFWRILGANPVAMAPTDVYMAFTTHVIDGADNDNANLWGYKLQEVAKNFLWIDYMAGSNPVMVSEKWHDSLPADLKKTFDQTVTESSLMGDKLTAEQEHGFGEDIAKASTTVVRVYDNPSLRDEWVKAEAPLAEQMVKQGVFTQTQLDDFQNTLKQLNAQ
jgi:TRAP-type C4-dicarboxylate transport system substrate-binding protein